MAYKNIVGISSRNSSYELTPLQMSPFITREGLQEAKKELEEIRKTKSKKLEEIEQEKRDRDELISDFELQEIMFPIQFLDKRIVELQNLIFNARIVEKSVNVSEEDIEEIISDYPEKNSNVPEDAVESSEMYDNPVENLYFIKDDVKVDAIPGDYSPFYAILDGGKIGYNRMLLNGWELVDNTGEHITDINEISAISNAIRKSKFIKNIKNKYPNAYSPWSNEENEKLILLYSDQGKALSEISEVLGRTKNGISIQLKKLLKIDRLPIRKKEKKLEEYSNHPFSITSIDPSKIADDKMPDYLNLIEQFEEWSKQVKLYAVNQAIENGICYEGYEIITTFRNDFIDKQKIIETIQTQYPDQYNKCVRLETISVIKKALGEDNFKSSIEEFVKQTEQHSLKKSKQ